MKKRMRLKLEGIGWFGDCPFCGHHQAINENMPWCAKCAVEYGERKTYEDKYGTMSYSYVVFDDKKKTERFAWAKALNLSGGVRIGKKD